MTRVVTICDSCGEERKESNHWWLIYPNDEDELVIQPLKHIGTRTSIKEKHLCGESCVIKAVSDFMHKDDVKEALLTSDDSDDIPF
jgi:hypothetical protein